VMAPTVVRKDKLRRWSLVTGVAAVLVVVPTVITALPVSVAAVEPARLAELIMKSADRPYQGYAESSGRLGVPELPNLKQVSSLLTGTTRIRSWYDSPTRWRFDVLSSFGGERDTFRLPDGEGIWDYGANLLTEVAGEQPVRLPRAGDVLPPDLARRVLGAALGDPLSPLPARREAGVSAAGLRVRPADPDTSVGQVDIWADPDSGLPVRVEVSARGASQPVLVTRFLELTQQRPAASALGLEQPPPDSGFTATTAPDIVSALGAAPASYPDLLAGRSLVTPEVAGLPGIAQYGTGLSSFVVLVLPRNLGGSATEAARKAGALELTLPGGSGVSLSVPPVSVIIERSNVARRSYLLAGLVIPSVLERAAAELSTVPRSGA
jgi:hypothetical protein